ncbi:MAG: transketolase [Anaerolineales bacterium]|nr:transketolase [Anaerolineales bacterium]
MEFNYKRGDNELIADTLRMLAIDAVQKANSGHPGLPLGAADIVAVLYSRFMKHNPANPRWPDRDRFVLSAGHGSALLYAMLHVTGYPMPLEELENFRQWGSLTPGHPEYDIEMGIETTTGPLGQGLGTAVGMALAERCLAARFNKPGLTLVDHYTYVLASDGDLMEGISHEAASFAGHLELGKLIVLFDDNHISIDGSLDLSCSDNVLNRFAAYGWHTQQVDGHDMDAIAVAIRTARMEKKPSIIACRTHIGYNSPLQDSSKAHGSPLGVEGVVKTKEAFGWPAELHFHVPSKVSNYFKTKNQEWASRQAEWEELLSRYREAFPELAEQWDLCMGGKTGLGEEWVEKLVDFTGSAPMATRSSSGKILDSISKVLPMLIGGSADLTPSNNTRPANSSALAKGDFSGSYIHFGIREHGMAAIMNGLCLHGGTRPYGGTFLVFSDYMRPSIRLAALMKQPVIYVFTHDSIGLGEDGPTHQPVEHLAALRSIPNLVVIRPADGNETSQAWRYALERTDGPIAFAFTRQSVPQITPKNNDLKKGAYILNQTEGSSLDLVMVASGSEVSIALKAQEMLAEKGICSRVVSMPSWELFDVQSESYRKEVLPENVPSLSIEAGITLGWSKYIGRHGQSIGVDSFGASAPSKIVLEKFGFTPEKIVERALGLLGEQ